MLKTDFLLTILPVIWGLVWPAEISAAGRLPGWTKGSDLINSGKIGKPVNLLELNFRYKKAANPQYSLISARTVKGFPRYRPLRDGDFTIILYDALRHQVLKTGYPDPLTTYDPPPQHDETASPPTIGQIDFAVTVDENPDAVSFSLLDSQNRLVFSGRLAGPVPTDFRIPDFYSVGGADYRKPVKGRIGIPHLQRVNAQDYGPVDIVFINDNIGTAPVTETDLETFRADVAGFTGHLLEYNPFINRRSQLYFHYVENTTDLQCLHNISMNRLITCSNSLIAQAVNNSGVPYDQIVVIVNDAEYGGSGSFSGISIAYNGNLGPQVFVHEFGHAFGKLRDEYNLYSGDGPVNGTVYGNCYAGIPPATDWRAWVGDANIAYTPGCMYANYYRSSASSIMLQLSSKYFNAVSQHLINLEINAISGPVDTVTPSPVPPTPTAQTDKSGDANGDNLVDGRDYDIWNNHYGQTGSGVADGNFNGDNIVDERDYQIWVTNYWKN